MKGLILAGGRSRRLFPITHRKPKCLLTIGGISIIDRIIHALKSSGVSSITVVLGFRAELLKKRLTLSYPDISFDFIENKIYATTNASYSLWLARDAFTLDDSVVYLNSDVLCDSAVIDEIVRNKNDSVTAIRQTSWDEEEVNVCLDRTQKVLRIGKNVSREESCGEFLGVTKIGPQFGQFLVRELEKYHQKEGDLFAVDLIDRAIQQGGSFYAHDVSMYVACEIDTIDDYKQAQLLGL